MKKLENKVAVITGGNSGIGLAAAKLFAQQGAKVAITGRNEASLAAAAAEINQETAPGPDQPAIGLACDVSNIHNIQRTYESIYEQLGKIDILIVNAGVQLSIAAADLTETQFDLLSNTNFKGAFFSVQLALPFLNDGASIILTSSAANEKGFSHNSAYSATKAAVRSLARSFSTELLSRRIRVNVLSPGAIDTPLWGRNGASPAEVDGVKEYMNGIIPAGRLGTSEEVAEGFLYLASDASRYMLGSELVMDGGVKTL